MDKEFKTNKRLKIPESRFATGQYNMLRHNGTTCPNCKLIIEGNYELCPHCGYRLHHDHCTFCGAPMDSDDLFCGECGGSAQGIICPTCGTLSFRSFCPKCNEPVDDIGRDELEKAKKDPLYQRITALAEKIEEFLESKSSENGEEQLSPEIAAILEKYRDLHISPNIQAKEEFTTSEAESVNHIVESNKAIKLTTSSISNLDFSSAIEELNDLLSSMVPDPGQTPQMQRNYYSARKVAVIRKSKVKEKIGWVCNLCGCCHGSPSECSRPELGGTWLYTEKEITIKTYE